MEINKRLGVSKTFEELKEGDVFLDEINGDCWMKTNPHGYGTEINGVSLEDGSTSYFEEKESVLLVQAILYIR